MKIFEINKKFLGFMGLLPHENTQSRTDYRFICFVVFLVIYTVSILYLGVKYIYDHLDHFDQLSDINFAIAQLVAVVPMCFSAATCAYKRRKIGEVIDGLQAIVNERRNISSIELYETANKNANMISFYFPFGMLSAHTITLMLLWCGFAIIYYIQDGHWDPANWYRPYKYSLPFDDTTYSGFIGYAIICYYAGSPYILLQATILSFFFSCCLFLRACCFDFKTTFDEMDSLSDIKSNESRLKFKKLLAKIVEFHIEIKRIFKSLGDIMSGTIFFQLLSGALLTATLLFEIAEKIDHPDISLLYFAVAIPVGLITLYVCCYAGSLLTAHFEELAYTIYQSKWYQYDPEMRKYLVLLIANCQQPMVFDGLKLIYLSLATFSKIMNTAVSYYLMFKNFSQAGR